MLIRLLIIRFCPFAVLRMLKEKKKVKKAVIGILMVYMVGFLMAAGKIAVEKQWLSILYVPLSMLPHYICYGVAVWMIIRCIWKAWSERVWRRIHLISLLFVLMGVLMENYLNPKILQIFFEIFK